MKSHNDSQFKTTNKINYLLLALKIRIYIGGLLTFVSALYYYGEQPIRGLLLIVIFSPYIVALLLINRRKKSFRIWYFIAAFISIIYCLLTCTMPLARASIEIIIVIFTFTYKYIDQNFS